MTDCPTPGKGTYESRRVATRAGRRSERRIGHRLFAYRCRCGSWHLTSDETDRREGSFAERVELGWEIRRRYQRKFRPNMSREQANEDLRSRVLAADIAPTPPCVPLDHPRREDAIAWLYLDHRTVVVVVGTVSHPVARSVIDLEGWQSGNAAAC